MRVAAKADELIRGERAKLTGDRIGYMVHPDWVSRAECRPPHALWQPRIDTRQGLAETARWYEAAGWL